MTVSLARKYRPKLLEDIVGQPSVVQTLTNAIKNNRLHQSYLFVGAFGAGKTSMARILAAMENCTVSPGLHPCGKCKVCQGIYSGTHTDINEIDAASSAGKVEQIRELKKDAMYRPVDGAITKTFIIDECQRMSESSNDALLKVLEEPPPHVRFILATTDVHQLRPAIQSRCQRHDFRKIYWTLMSDHLEKICKQEKVSCEPGALSICAKLANGSMRNALENLDKLIDFAGSNIVTLDHAQQLFSVVSDSVFYDIIDQIIGHAEGKADATEGFKILNMMLSSGSEFQMIYDGIADHLRNLLIGMTSKKAGSFLQLNEESKNRFKIQRENCISRNNPIIAIKESIRSLHDAKVSVEHNLSPEVALQLWLIESIFAFKQ